MPYLWKSVLICGFILCFTWNTFSVKESSRILILNLLDFHSTLFPPTGCFELLDYIKFVHKLSTISIFSVNHQNSAKFLYFKNLQICFEFVKFSPVFFPSYPQVMQTRPFYLEIMLFFYDELSSLRTQAVNTSSQGTLTLKALTSPFWGFVINPQ